MSGHRQLQEEEGLNDIPREMEHFLAYVEQSKRKNHSDKARESGQGQNHPHIPFFRFLSKPDIVVSNGHDGRIVEERQQNDHNGGHGIEIENQSGKGDKK
jgi:hypothetical protein